MASWIVCLAVAGCFAVTPTLAFGAGSTMHPKQTRQGHKADPLSPAEERWARLVEQMDAINKRLNELDQQLRTEISVLGSLSDRVDAAATEARDVEQAYFDAEYELLKTPEIPFAPYQAQKAKVAGLRKSVEAARVKWEAATSDYETQQQKVSGLQSEIDRLRLEWRTLLRQIQDELDTVNDTLNQILKLPPKGG
jgi:hypothetical protein